VLWRSLTKASQPALVRIRWTPDGRGRGPAKGHSIRAEQAGMTGREHASVELTVSVEVPCPECGGRGYVEKVGGTGRRISDRTQPCLPCSGKGLIPKNMPLSQFQALLASQAH
jgi:DnaJ-class molecular chaperone